jgi:hypothetical protein
MTLLRISGNGLGDETMSRAATSLSEGSGAHRKRECQFVLTYKLLRVKIVLLEVL